MPNTYSDTDTQGQVQITPRRVRRVAIVSAMATKSLEPKQKRAVRRALAELMASAKLEKQKDAARVLGISQPQISDILNEQGGAGAATLVKISKHAGKLVDRILGLAHTDVLVAIEYSSTKFEPDVVQWGLARAEHEQHSPRRWEELLRERQEKGTPLEELGGEIDRTSMSAEPRKRRVAR